MLLEKLKKSHIVVVCEGPLDKCLIEEIAQRLGFKIGVVHDLEELSFNLRRLRPLESSGKCRVIVLPVRGPVKSLLHRVLDHVINANYHACAHLAKVLALVDQDDAPTPIDKANRVIKDTLEALRSLWSRYKPEPELKDNVYFKSSSYIDKLIGKGEGEYARTLLRVVVVDNCLECELLRILKGTRIYDREQCHEELKELKETLTSTSESEDCRGYSKLISNAIDMVENSSSQPPWYASIKYFLQEEL